MTSLSGTKERPVSSRSRKYGMPDTSPTKSSSFFPDTWYRKTYEETARSNTRPAPEGAGSMPSSTGTPSPGSGISSPGSFSGSPGTISPGIGTGSPGSLGGSPGFGTGSPASGSGSSPGSERVIWCETCNARLTELKRQALKLLIPGPYSSKDPSFSLLLHEKLQVPNSSRRAWNERDSRCDVCATHLTQLKQEAVRMVLSLDQWDLSPTSSPPPLTGRYGSQGPQMAASGASREWPPPFPPSSTSAAPVSHSPHSSSPSPSPNHTPTPSPSHGSSNASHSSPSAGQTSCCAPTNQQPPGAGHRLGSKPSSLGLGGGMDRRNGSPSSGKAAGVQQQSGTGVNSPSNNGGNSSNNGSGPVQAHQHLNRTNGGVTLYPYQISQMISEASREELTEAALNRYNTHSPLHTNSSSYSNSPAHTSAATTTAPTTTSAAASFFARAAQKLSLASKKKKQKTATVTVPVTSSSPPCDPHMFPTNFSSALAMAPPPAPPCLLRAANKIKDTPGLGKVKVMVRVCPVSQSDAAESSSFLKVDPRKKQITIMDPSANQTPTTASQKRVIANQIPPKMFNFDAAFPPDASQAEVCAGTVAEVIQSVVNGADGCVFCFGHSKLGKSYTMIGRDDSLQTLGIIPCAISWLFKLINERKEKTGARFSVRVSAVEVWGREENLKDLLSEVATGSLQDGQSPGVYLCEDPICGMQLQNQSELRAPTPEKAAWFLDAAIAARHSSQRPNTTEEDHRNSHMLFTLHIYQYRMEKTGKGGMSGGRSRLHLLDLGSCDVKVLGGGGGVGGKNRDNSSPSSAPLCLSLSALGNVILALVNGSKHIPYKDSKLTMLLRESLGNMNCRTTMIAHISASPRDFSETLSTIQIASRVLRMKKKKTKVTVQYTSSSSGGESSCEEGRMRRPTHLRPFHHRGDTDSDLPLLRLSSDPDEYSSSEQSCDTVIYVGPNGSAVSDRELTDNEGPPEFVPIIPALLRGKPSEQHQAQSQNQAVGVQNKVLSQPDEQPGGPSQPLSQTSQSLLGQPLAPVPEEGAECLKCNTFAELQERLDCIDGSEEVAKFPFEEVPACKQGAKQEQCPSSASAPGNAAVVDTGSAVGGAASSARRRTNDQQLQEINEVVEEAELAQTMIHSLAQCSGCPIVTSAKSATGSSSSITSNPLHRTKSSHLHDSRESLNMVGGNAEGKARPLGSPRLGIASLTKTSEYRPPCSPSQRCKVYTQKGVMPVMPPLSSQTQDGQATEALTSDNSLAADSGRSSTESLLSRTSPAGMSPQVREPTPSLSASLGSAETLCDDDVPPIPLDMHKDASGVATSAEMCKLVVMGENELGYTVVSGGEEDPDVTAAIETCGVTCRPVSIISFNSDCGSATALASDSVPISRNSTAMDRAVEGHLIFLGPATTSGVTEVVAMAEVAMAKLRTEGEAMVTGISNCGSSNSSWVSDLSMGSEADQSLHSFSQSQSQQGEALADPEPNQNFGVEELGGYESGRCLRRGSLEGELLLSENIHDKGTPTKDRQKKMPPSMAQTNIQMLAGPGNLSPFKTPISVHPCVAVKPIVIQEATILSSPSKTSLVKNPIKPSAALIGSISSEMSFEDPWLKRDTEEGRSKELVCEVKPEKQEMENSKEKTAGGNADQRSICRNDGDHDSSGGEMASSPDSIKRVVDGCEMVALVSQSECLATVYNPDIHRTSSLPRGWHSLNRHDGLDSGVECPNLGVTTSTPCSPRATLDRRGSNGKQGFFSYKKGGIPPLPPVRKSSLDQRNRAASPLHQISQGVSLQSSSADDEGTSTCGPAGATRQRGASIDSSRLFSAKLEQLANRTNSLGRAHSSNSGSHHYDCFSLERGESVRGGGGVRGDTMPRTGRSLTRAGSVSSPTANSGSVILSGSHSLNSTPQSPAKTSSQSKISAVSKLLMTSSPKSRSLSASSTKTLSFSTKSLSQTGSRSSSLPPNGKPQTSVQCLLQQPQGPASGSWSTQSLSRSRGGSLAAKLPLRAVNGRISELLQGSARTHAQGGSTDPTEEKGVGGASGGGTEVGGGSRDSPKEEKTAVVQTLPSPYSKITAPRKPHRCSSGHASDNSSVLSGELPPAMGKTALFYHSGGSSGYESMLRDSSENTGSTSSAQDSLSEHSSATTSSRRSSKSNKKSRSNTGLQRRRLIPALTLDSSSSSPSHRSSKQTITSSSSSSSSPGACWVDGPLGPPTPSNLRGATATTETFEIKVYEIDDVERLQKRRDKGGSKEVVYVNAKLRLLEHRQQRISEVRAKYQCLKKELEQTKQYLMLEPHKWTTEFELQQPYEVDSLEYLEALEMVTDKLETRVNFCKAHLMMITCFDVSSRHR
ncbi:kinesin-like protein KIF26B [Pholidichthys leucotaenia]